MWIQELYLKNFGKFTEKKIILGPGINLIYGQNESGKSTLHAFIRGCLYGIRKMRGRGSKTDVFSRYQPWENSAYYAGNMRFVCGDKVFRLERNFAKTGREDRLVCESDGETLSLEDGDLQMLLGNVGEVTFDNTVSIGQLKNETDEGLAVELKNHMANIEGTGISAIRVEKALSHLKERKKYLEKRLVDKKRQEEDKISRIEDKIRFLQEDCEKEKNERAKAWKALSELSDDLKEIEISSLEDSGTTDSSASRPGFFRRIWLAVREFFRRLFGISRKASAISNEEPGKKELEKNEADKNRLLGKIEHLDGQIQEKKVRIQNHRQEIEAKRVEIFALESSEEKQEIDACSLAMDRIQEVVSGMQMDIGQFLKKRTSEIFSEITKGRYPFVEISQDLKPGVHGMDRALGLESLSRGTIWQLYFALRMGANQVLCQEEDLPVILDDAFAMYDDDRLSQTLTWLCKQKKQVIIFTCQEREREWFLRRGITFTDITLTR